MRDRRRWALVMAAMTSLGGSLLPLACDSGASFTETRSFTSTVTIGNATRLQVDVLVPLVIVGERRDDVVVELDLSVTASATDVAQRALDAWTLGEGNEGGTAFVVVGPPSDGFLGGSAVVRAPRDVDLRILQRGGTVGVADMERGIEIDSVGAVQVAAADDDLVIRVESGDVRADHQLRAGARVDIAVGNGNVQVDLPVPLDANVDAASTQGVTSMHRDLPSRPASIPYRETAGGGNASVVATTTGGGVIFTERRTN